MKKIVSFFRRWYYRRLFFKIYNHYVFSRNKDAEYSVRLASEAVNAIWDYFHPENIYNDKSE